MPEDKKEVTMVVSAARAFRKAGGPTPQTIAELGQALESVGGVTVEEGYSRKTRTVRVAADKVEDLKKAVGDKYIVEPQAYLSIDI